MENSYYVDDIRRAKELSAKGIHYVDVGTSGGVWGMKRGYCMMIGGDKEVIQHLNPLLAALAPGPGTIARTPASENMSSTAEQGYLHCGPNGAGHFVKMVHNGIEYGIMAAYAEGLSVLREANIGKNRSAIDAETTPLRHPEHYRYDFSLPDITEVWRRGSVIAVASGFDRGSFGPGPRSFKFYRPRLRFWRRTLDDQSCYRRSRVRACSFLGSLRTVQFARPGGFSEQAPLRNAI